MDSSVSNLVEAVNCSSFPAVDIDGTNNYVRVISNLASQVTLGGVSNTFEFAKGVLSKWPTMIGEGFKVFDFCGGAQTNNTYSFSGTNCTVIVRDGARLQYGDGNVVKNTFNFVPKATRI